MIGLRVGIVTGRRGIAAGIGSDESSNSGPDADAASGRLVPSTSSQYTALGLVAPNDIWTCQEASGNLVSDNGTILTANATPLYQQALAGWTGKAVGFNGGANQRFQHATYNNAATSSLLALLYMVVTTTPAGAQGVLTAGTSFSAGGLSITATPRLRYRNGATIVDSANPYNTVVVPVVFKHDITNSVARAFTDIEKLSPTFGAAAGTIFGVGTGTAAHFLLRYLAVWRGAAAEQSDTAIKTMLQTLRWSPTWTP